MCVESYLSTFPRIQAAFANIIKQDKRISQTISQINQMNKTFGKRLSETKKKQLIKEVNIK